MATNRAVNVLPAELQRLLDAGATSTDQAVSKRDFGRYRVPTIVTTVRSLEEGDADQIIKCWVNPGEFGWTIPQRGAIQKVRGGSVRYVWHNRKRKTFLDEFKVNITFSSGNILPSAYAGGVNSREEQLARANLAGLTAEYRAQLQENNKVDTATLVPPGLDNLYQFFKLFDQGPFMSDGRENLHIIFHNSPVFPSIVLKGWFDPAGITLSESAEASWEVKWSIPFEVLHTTPKITDLKGLRSVYGLVTT